MIDGRRLGRSVTAPDGQEWVIRRRWLPRLGAETLWGGFRRRVRRMLPRSADLADGSSLPDFFTEGAVAGVVMIGVVLVLAFVAVPLLVAVLDVLVVMALALIGAVGRVMFRRPWTVEARCRDGDEEPLTWRIVGWRASRDHRNDIAGKLAAGITPPPEVRRL